MKTSILSRILRVAENLYRDPESKRYYGVKKIARRKALHSLDTTDQATAKRELKKWLAKLDARDPRALDLKLDALIQRFLDARKKETRTATNYESIARRLRNSFQLGTAVPVRKIKTSDLLAWLNHEAAVSEWSGSYFNAVRLFVRQMFELAVADGVLSESENPFRPKLIKTRKRDKTIRRIPTLEQFRKIIEDVQKNGGNGIREESANFLEFLGLAGIGQAEAARFTWRDDRGTKLRFVRQKTSKEFFIPVYPWLAPYTAKLRSQRNSAGDDARVFRIDDAKKALRGACKRLKIHQFTQRNLRAMCIKRLYDAGVPVKRIALWQGHSDGGQLIQQVYTEVFSDNDAAAEAADLALLKPNANGRKIVNFAA